MSRIRVVVTGLGATTPLGGDVSATWDGLLAGKSGGISVHRSC
jgi:3-oxoacyl-[acyl-carrier-protein] synthase II